MIGLVSTPESEATGPLTCSICGCSSQWREAFKRVKDGTLVRLCCPKCASRKIAKLAKIGFGALAIGVALFVAQISAGHAGGAEIWIFGLMLFLVFSQLLVPFHELGHVLAAHLVGARAYAVCVGDEPWYIDRTWRGIRWRMGLTLTGGLTYHGPCDGSHQRLRYIVIMSGGLVVNLLIAIVAYAIAMSHFKAPASPLAGLAFFILAATSAYQFVANLWPRQVTFSVGKVSTDGARILGLLRGVATDGQLLRAAMHHMRAHFAFLDRDFEVAGREAELAHSSWDGSKPEFQAARESMIIRRAAARAESDDAEGTIALLQPLVDPPSGNLGTRSGVEDNLAWAYLLVDEPKLLERALALAESARAIAPWHAPYIICRACLLAATASSSNGRLDEARRQIASLSGETLSRQSATYAELARGLCAAAAGDAAASRRYYESAKSLGATAAPLRVLERRIPSP
jgi:hypothetical protein